MISRCSILFYEAVQAIWPAVGIFQVGGFTSCTGGSYKFPEWPVRIFQLHPVTPRHFARLLGFSKLAILLAARAAVTNFLCGQCEFSGWTLAFCDGYK
jgi:hypothetical protein